MTDPSQPVSIDRNDPAFKAAVATALELRITELLSAASDRLDAEADVRLRRGHDVEHITGWREAAQWQREQAAKL